MHGHIIGSSLALDAVDKGSHNQLVATKRAIATSRKTIGNVSIINNQPAETTNQQQQKQKHQLVAIKMAAIN